MESVLRDGGRDYTGGNKDNVGGQGSYSEGKAKLRMLAVQSEAETDEKV